MDAASRILTGNYCNPPEVKKNTARQCQALKRLATGDWRDEYDAHIPRLFNPGILRDINNIVINQRTTSRFCEDGDKVRFWIHFTNRNRSTTGIYQVFSSIGNIAPRRIEAIAARYFADMPATVRSICRTAPAPVAPFERSIARHTHQSHCIVGARAYGILDPKRLPLALLVNMLGGPSANSMLNVTVREKHGLSYSIEGSYTPYGDAGIVAIYFSSDHDNCDRCLELVRGQIDSLRTRRLSTRRLALAKKQFVAQLAISMESNEGYMLGAGKSYLVHSEVDTMEEVYRKISDLQAGELLEVANEVLASPSLLVYR